MNDNLPPLPPACGAETLSAIGCGYTEDDMQTYARAALAQAQSCVPAGYVLAPVEPNRAMRQAAIKEQVMHRNAGLSLDGDEPAAVIYRAMLAASPAQPKD